MVMTLVALTGAVSHVSMGAQVELLPGVTIILTCLISAVISAKFANRCDVKKPNHIVGVVLIVSKTVVTAFLTAVSEVR